MRSSMRCLLTAATVTTVLCLGGGSAVAAPLVTSIQKARVDVGLTPPATWGAPQPVSLTLATSFSPADLMTDIDAGNQFAPVHGHLSLPPELNVDFSAIPSCSASQVFQDESQCPADSQVGTGTATLVGLNLVNNMTIKLFNRPNGLGLVALVLSTPDAPVEIRDLITLAPRADGRPTYGTRLFFSVPFTVMGPVQGILAAWQDFTLTIPAKVNASNVPFIGMTGCADGSLAFEYAAAYTTEIPVSGAVESSQSVPLSLPCTGSTGNFVGGSGVPTSGDITGDGSDTGGTGGDGGGGGGGGGGTGGTDQTPVPPTPPVTPPVAPTSTPVVVPPAKAPPLTRKQKLKAAIAKCNKTYKGSSPRKKKKRAACIKSARKKYR